MVCSYLYLQAMQATCRMPVPPLSLPYLALINVPRLDGVWNVLRNFSSDSLFYPPENYVGRTRFNAILRLSYTTIRRMAQQVDNLQEYRIVRNATVRTRFINQGSNSSADLPLYPCTNTLCFSCRTSCLTRHSPRERRY
jgi:hypothetical protein